MHLGFFRLCKTHYQMLVGMQGIVFIINKKSNQRIVIPVVAGSSPVAHPININKLVLLHAKKIGYGHDYGHN